MAGHDYVLGTHDEEIDRLGLQHRVWRPAALAAWQRAGFRTGQRIVDLGCGPGFASVDLAEVVGPNGRIVAVDGSERFLEHLKAERARRALSQLDLYRADFDAEFQLPGDNDGLWCRWASCFVRDPRRLVERACSLVRTGGALVFHEYADYRTWRMMPPEPELEGFVDTVMKAWRADGGEPNVGRWIPSWLEELGLTVTSTELHGAVITPRQYMWEWPAAFVRNGTQRLARLGYFDSARATTIVDAFEAAARTPGTRLVTPLVIEIIAKK
jgi:SAM-dependent methyltransferase